MSERSMWKKRHTVGVVTLTAILGLGLLLRPQPLWKSLQDDDLQWRVDRLEEQLRIASEAISPQRSELEATMSAQTAELESRRDEVRRFERDLGALARRRQAAERRRENVEQALERQRELLSAAGTNQAPEARQKILTRIEELRQASRSARMEIESVAELEEVSQHELRVLRSDLDASTEQLADLEAPVRELESRLGALESLEPEVRAVDPVDYPRAFPASAPRQDRCITCHLGIDQDENAVREAVFAPHPRLDLFVGSDSPHALERFGCTTCHGGEGLALDFSRAGHRPRDDAQAERWRALWGWRADHVAMDPILGAGLVEAGCAACHDQRRIDGASELGSGRVEVARLGCAACHDWDAAALPVAPSLSRLAAKTSKAWAYHWIAAPRNLDPRARMPHLFNLEDGDLEDGADSESRQRQQAEIRAIVLWLWHRSEPFDPDADRKTGDVDAGEQLFATLGCEGCHREDGESSGPRLFGLGDKVDGGWLYAWLRDPRAYHPATRMPDLRLSERESSDLAAFLLESKNPAIADELPALDAARRDELVLAYLQQEMTIEESQARFEKMGDDARELFLGERAYRRHACGACHDGLSSPEAADRHYPLSAGITTSLTHHQDQDHDQGQDRDHDGTLPLSPSEYVDRPPRPRYAFDDQQQARLQLALLALERPRLRQARRSTRQQVLERGRDLIERHGCRGCHRIEGRGQSPDGWQHPAPDLTGYGSKIRPRWLLAYLDEPGAFELRSWQSLRMPSYHLSPADRRDLVAYFATLEEMSLLVEEPPIAPLDAAVGAVVYDLLQCDSCHQGAASSSEPAPPPYDLAHRRLRPDWVVEWILDPRSFVPDTTMPTTFAYESRQQTDSFLSMAIGAPMYWQERGRLRRFFDSEEAMVDYLSHPENLARALRAHLWTSGE